MSINEGYMVKNRFLQCYRIFRGGLEGDNSCYIETQPGEQV
ncbi:hypothetical protein HMPREF9548_01800 [Escherichia coli MS 182-1]|nr:hypothetical protein HMPREF9548_01800 [Escherichia coli MS 182-1]KDW75232.1 hypothetical protein AB14_1269 [Escherichia coli 1-392-07_S1_C1]KDW84288.1 hypothetical protein AB42_0803 [Escherichia coli 1-392-07_S1_C2]